MNQRFPKKQDYFDQFMHHQQNFAICMQQNLIDYSLGCDMFTLQILEHCKFREETTYIPLDATSPMLGVRHCPFN